METCATPETADTSGGAQPYSPHWLFWQLADSVLPCGGFAHSGGLEAALQQGELRNAEDLEGFILASLAQLGRASLPFMTATHAHPENLGELDRVCDAFTSNHVANRASRLQGQALLATAERVFATPDIQRLRQAKSPGPRHLAPIFGLLLRELGFGREEASRLFLFWHLRGLISASVRLNLVGPLQGQTLQCRLAAKAEAVLQRCQHLPVSGVAQTAPLLDLWQANQDRLYSRLFQS